MAVLYVTEFSRTGRGGDGLPVQAADQPVVVEQTVAIGGASASSSAFNALTKLVRIHTDAICSIVFGTAPTATTSKMRLAAGQTEYFSVPLNGGYKVAVITNT